MNRRHASGSRVATRRINDGDVALYSELAVLDVGITILSGKISGEKQPKVDADFSQKDADEESRLELVFQPVVHSAFGMKFNV